MIGRDKGFIDKGSIRIIRIMIKGAGVSPASFLGANYGMKFIMVKRGGEGNTMYTRILTV